MGLTTDLQDFLWPCYLVHPFARMASMPPGGAGAAPSRVRTPSLSHAAAAAVQIASDGLKNRVVEVSLADLQKNEEDAYRKIRLRIEDVQVGGRTRRRSVISLGSALDAECRPDSCVYKFLLGPALAGCPSFCLMAVQALDTRSFGGPRAHRTAYLLSIARATCDGPCLFAGQNHPLGTFAAAYWGCPFH